MKKKIVFALVALVVCVSAFIACGNVSAELKRVLNADTLKNTLSNVKMELFTSDYMDDESFIIRDGDKYCSNRKFGVDRFYEKTDSGYYVFQYISPFTWIRSQIDFLVNDDALFLVYFSILTALDAKHFEASAKDGWYYMKKSCYADYLAAININFYAEFNEDIKDGVLRTYTGYHELDDIDYFKIAIEDEKIKSVETSVPFTSAYIPTVFRLTLSDYGNTTVILPFTV